MDKPDRDWGLLARGIAFLGSLKLTVTLLAMSIFLVFAGTLAQVDKGLWHAVDQYFRCWYAWVEMRIFFPADSGIRGGFPFPGGRLLGAALVVNLLVAHALRINLKARGARLVLGLAVTAIGGALTWFVITNVFDADSSLSKATPTWRVTLQLIEGAAAATVLFMGCKVLFERKAGIVLLHGGVVLMMSSELIADYMTQEGVMTVYEGQKVNFAEDNRYCELAILDTSPKEHDNVAVVPGWILERGGSISAPDLPFDLEVPQGRFFRNSGLRELSREDANPSTEGSGLAYFAVAAKEATGSSVDFPAAYVTFKEKGTGRTLGTWLTSAELSYQKIPQRVTSAGKTYDVYLRFKRLYKPYSVYLYDARWDTYEGTRKPKDYSSYIRLTDPGRGVERDVRVWMNNPFRYQGDTIYQSSFDEATDSFTGLQIVDNASWMIPYVSCMIVAAGLLGQFSLHLFGFLRRRRDAS